MKAQEKNALLATLAARFDQNMLRHEGVVWADVQGRLAASPAKLRALGEMESTGGEPDVVGFDSDSGRFTFYDCSPETPLGRRSLCYDREGLESRKENRPANSAVDLAVAMGVELLTEEEYRQLQALGKFDLKTSSWLAAPPEIRKLGGAIFGDCRYGRVFVYHNGAQSYYASRGFRAALKV
jgi:hypothetical protein